MSRVLYAERRLPHYRTRLLDLTKAWLEAHGVQFDFIHGDPTQTELSKGDEGKLPWAQRMRATHYALSDKVAWQPFETRGYDLVIVSHENGLLFNHWLARPWRPFRLGFIGHGANFAAHDRDSWRERFKRRTVRQADWWFAYTSISRHLVIEAGYPAERVCVVDNTIDTRALRAAISAVTPAQIEALRREHGLSPNKTALFLGSMYAGKSLELLIEAASGVHAADPAFRLLMVGDGPSRAHAQAASEGLEFIRWLGVQRGTEKAALMAVSDFMLMPGSIGLAIVDAFTAGLPLLATEAPGHGPELAYLVPGSNGALTRADAASYIAIIRELLGNPQQLHRWRRQAASDGQRYSVEGMAERFGQGILDALAHPRL